MIASDLLTKSSSGRSNSRTGGGCEIINKKSNQQVPARNNKEDDLNILTLEKFEILFAVFLLEFGSL